MNAQTRTCSCCSRPLLSTKAQYHPECKNYQSFYQAAVNHLEGMLWAEEAAYLDGDSNKWMSGHCLRRVRSLWTRSCNQMTKGYVLTAESAESFKDAHSRTSANKRCPQCGKLHNAEGTHCLECVTWIRSCQDRKVCTVCNCQLEKPKRGPMPVACKGCRDFINFLTGAVKAAQTIRYAGGHVELKQKKGAVVKTVVRNMKAKQQTTDMWAILNYTLRPHVVAMRRRSTNTVEAFSPNGVGTANPPLASGYLRGETP